MKEKLIVFHPALAPYRIDFFNFLSNNYDAKFYFSSDNLKNQKFDQKKIREMAEFEFNLLSTGFELGKRSIRTGIIRKIKSFKPDIIVCSEYSQITIIVLLYKLFIDKKIRVYTISDDSLDLSVKRSGLRSWIRKISSFVLNGIIFPSAEVGNWYSENINKIPKVIEIPIVHSNSLFRSRLQSSISLSNTYLESYKLTDKNISIFVGRLVPEKNVLLLLKTFHKSLTANSVLIIIGDGPLKDDVLKYIKDNNLSDRVLLPGRFEGDKLLAWYNIARYLILPSYYEPYGAVVNEALLAGCKVICSKYAGASALINDENGIIFNPDCENELISIFAKMNNINQSNALIQTIRKDLMPFDLNDKLIDLKSIL